MSATNWHKVPNSLFELFRLSRLESKTVVENDVNSGTGLSSNDKHNTNYCL